MEGAAQTLRRAETTVVEGAGEAALEDIRAGGVAAAIWRRRLDAGLLSRLAALPAEALPALRAELRPAESARAVEAACGPAAAPCAAGLAADVGMLAARFARIMRAKAIRLRLDVVDTDSCRRFHQDQVTARLLCSYRGAGTEYGLAGPDGTPADIQRMRTGWVGLFRGRRWPACGAGRLVHRSPPIGESGETRLLLVIDAPEP